MSASPCLSRFSALTHHIVNIDRLPVEMIQKIATYLPTNDYDNFRVTNRTICNALISINSMHKALAEKPHYGALGAFYKTCAEAKHLEACCSKLTENEITTLLNIRVRADGRPDRATSVTVGLQLGFVLKRLRS
ncbi:F-box protein [Symbiopectobacterium sp. RP]